MVAVVVALIVFFSIRSVYILIVKLVTITTVVSLATQVVSQRRLLEWLCCGELLALRAAGRLVEIHQEPCLAVGAYGCFFISYFTRIGWSSGLY